MKFTKKPRLFAGAAMAAIGLSLAALPALAAPVLGSDLASFAVLGSAGVTNVPTSTVGGNLGSAPNPSVGGGYIFSSGSFQQNTALAQSAQLQLDTAIATLNGMSISGGALGAVQNGTTIGPGVYDFSAGLDLSGNVVLDGTGSGNTAVWVFRMVSTLITSTTSNVTVTNVGDGSGVGIYWVVGSGATLNGPTFAGNVLAHDLISSDGDLTIGCGRLLSATTQVTLIHDKVSIGCADFGGVSGTIGGGGAFDQGADIGSGGTGGSNGQVVNGVPEPGTLALLGLGLGAAGFMRRRR